MAALISAQPLGVAPLLRDEDVVGARARLAVAAVGHRIRERRLVARVLPDQPVHQDGGVEPLHVVAVVDDRAPPGALDVVLQLDAQRAVVPGAAEAAVDGRRREDEPAALGEADDLFEAMTRAWRRGRLRQSSTTPPAQRSSGDVVDDLDQQLLRAVEVERPRAVAVGLGLRLERDAVRSRWAAQASTSAGAATAMPMWSRLPAAGGVLPRCSARLSRAAAQVDVVGSGRHSTS